MRILFFSDLHIKLQGEFSNVDVNLDSPNKQLFLNTLESLKRICRDKNIELILLGGDIFNDNGFIDPLSLDFITNHLKSTLMEIGLPVYGITGNHDMYDKGQRINLLKCLDNTTGVMISTHNTMTRIVHNGQGIILLPYYYKFDDEFYDQLGSLMHETDLILCHNDIKGTYVAPKITIRGGLDLIRVNDIWSRKFPYQFINIFNGHYHAPSTNNMEGMVRLHQIGAPYYRDFGDTDRDLPRGFMIHDTYHMSIIVEENLHSDLFITVRNNDKDYAYLKSLSKSAYRIHVRSHINIADSHLYKSYRFIDTSQQVSTSTDIDHVEIPTISIKDAIDTYIDNHKSEISKEEIINYYDTHIA